MSIGFLFFVRDSLSIVIDVAIASSSRILFSNPFMPLLMTTGSRLKCPAVALNGRLANSFPKYPTTALPNAPGRLRVLLYNKSLDMFDPLISAREFFLKIDYVSSKIIGGVNKIISIRKAFKSFADDKNLSDENGAAICKKESSEDLIPLGRPLL